MLLFVYPTGHMNSFSNNNVPKQNMDKCIVSYQVKKIQKDTKLTFNNSNTNQKKVLKNNHKNINNQKYQMQIGEENYNFDIINYFFAALGSPIVAETFFRLLIIRVISDIMSWTVILSCIFLPCILLAITLVPDYNLNSMICVLIRLCVLCIILIIGLTTFKTFLDKLYQNNIEKMRRVFELSLSEQKDIIIDNIDPRFSSEDNIIQDTIIKLTKINQYIYNQCFMYLFGVIPMVISLCILKLFIGKEVLFNFITGNLKSLVKTTQQRSIFKTNQILTSLNIDIFYDVIKQYIDFYNLLQQIFQIMPMLIHVVYFLYTTTYNKSFSGKEASKRSFNGILDSILVIKTCDLNKPIEKYFNRLTNIEYKMQMKKIWFDMCVTLAFFIVIVICIIVIGIYHVMNANNHVDQATILLSITQFYNQLNKKKVNDNITGIVSFFATGSKFLINLFKLIDQSKIMILGVIALWCLSSFLHDICITFKQVRNILDLIITVASIPLSKNPGQPFFGNVQFIQINWNTSIGYREPVINIKQKQNETIINEKKDKDKKTNIQLNPFHNLNNIFHSTKLTSEYYNFLKNKLKEQNIQKSDSNDTKLSNITLHNGEIFFLMGVSGSGKSTFIKSLMKLTKVFSGGLFIFDSIIYHNIHNIRRNDLKRFFGWCTQKLIFGDDDTVASFLRKLSNNASETEMKHVLAKVQMLEWLESQPHKFRTKLGSGGRTISGGQAARLYIAGNLLKAKGSSFFYLILDETLDALNEEIKKEVIIMVAKLVEKKQIGLICISHTTPMLIKILQEYNPQLKISILDIAEGNVSQMELNEFLSRSQLGSVDTSSDTKDHDGDHESIIDDEEIIELDPYLLSVFNAEDVSIIKSINRKKISNNKNIDLQDNTNSNLNNVFNSQAKALK